MLCSLSVVVCSCSMITSEFASDLPSLVSSFNTELIAELITELPSISLALVSTCFLNDSSDTAFISAAAFSSSSSDDSSNTRTDSSPCIGDSLLVGTGVV